MSRELSKLAFNERVLHEAGPLFRRQAACYHDSLKPALAAEGIELSTTRTSPRWNGTKIYFTGHSLHNEYWDLLIAPGNMRERFVDLIRQEADHARAGREAKIIHDRIDTDPFEAVADIVKSFPLVITWDDAIAVHGGVHPD